MLLKTYMITGGAAAHEELASMARALELGVDLFQVRRRSETARNLEVFTRSALERSSAMRERLLVNDRLDVALATGAGGVHLPADGLPVASVRRRVPHGFCIGVSAHGSDEVRRAGDDGASFVVFGPIFPTPSKPGHPGVGLGALAEAVRRSSIPVFALGGITSRHVDAVRDAGASGIAGISTFADPRALTDLLSAIGRRGER